MLFNHCSVSNFKATIPTLYSRNVFIAFNLMVYQVIWWLAALYQQNLNGTLVLILVFYFLLSPDKKSDLKHLLITFIGCTVDQILVYSNVIFNEREFIPLYLAIIWVMLAWSFCYSLNFLTMLSVRWLAVIGGVTGAFSYYSAWQLGAVTSELSAVTFIGIYAVIWAVLLPCFVKLSLFLSPRGGQNIN